MKKLLFILLTATATATSSQAQTDTARQTITLKMKVKHYAFMLKIMNDQPVINNYTLKSTLAAAIANISQLDSQITTTLKAGVYIRFIEALCETKTGSYYSFLNEIQTSTAAQGWQGLSVQLNAKITAGGQEGKTAKWLKDQLNTLLVADGKLKDQDINTGVNYGLTPIDEN